MSDSPLITYQAGPLWSFTFDASQAPTYVLFTVRGKPCLERMRRMLALLRGQQHRSLLGSGLFCPIIIDRREDRVPAPAVLQSWRIVMEQVQQQMSALITIVDPTRPDHLLMDISLEILGQFLLPSCITVTSWEEAMEQVMLFHAKQGMRLTNELAQPWGGRQ